MYAIIKSILIKAIALILITILPIALYIYIEDDVQITWNINDTKRMNKYIVTVEVNPENKQIYIKEKVEFVNKTKKELDKIFFYIFPQSLSLDDVCLDLRNELGVQTLEDKSRIVMNIESIRRKGKALDYKIIGKNQNIVMVKLDTKIKENQNVDIEIEGVLGFPHVTDKTEDGRNVYDIIDWHPIIAEYNEGWVLSVEEKIIEPIYDNEYYYIEIIVPEKIDVSALGVLMDKERKGGKLYFRYQNKKLINFTFSIK